MKLKAVKEGNWGLIFFSGIVFALGITLVILAIVFYKQLGWWSLAVFASGFSSAYLSFIAVKDNEPAWLLLDLILPG